MSFAFNIIYTPGTAIYLAPLVHSLLTWSDCTFRLVANGCPTSEHGYLRNFCANSSRLEFLALPTSKMVPHGKALAFLHEQTTSDYFCFMDSDILATGDFVEALKLRLRDRSAFFSCNPIWCKPAEQILPDDSPVIHGRYHSTRTGLCLGSSYFAIYDNQVLADFLHTSPIGFDLYDWPRVPKRCQKTLAGLGQQRVRYDTCKVLNLLLLAQGENMIFWNSPDLLHLGGFSRYRQHQAPKAGRRLYSSQYSIKGNLNRLWNRFYYAGNLDSLMGIVPERYLPLRMRQVAVERYMSNLIMALHRKTILPEFPQIRDVGLREEIERATSELVSIYKVTEYQ
ncbi:glycosyltransferase [Chloroflexi bacterium TSY]|nr:glycosyltransferase [Chloroflexi bacterium TSY]